MSLDCLSLRLRLARLDLFHRTAGVAPRREAAAEMPDRFQSHVLRGLRRQRGTHAAGTVENKFLVLLKYRFGLGTFGIDPEFHQAARPGEHPATRPPAL